MKKDIKWKDNLTYDHFLDPNNMVDCSLAPKSKWWLVSWRMKGDESQKCSSIVWELVKVQTGLQKENFKMQNDSFGHLGTKWINAVATTS